MPKRQGTGKPRNMPQSLPQTPQFLASLRRLAHLLLQQVSPAWQEGLHSSPQTPLMQPILHFLPQVPQLLGSLWVSTQPVEQQSWLMGQTMPLALQVQPPPLQVSLLLQVLPQEPQLRGSVSRFTQPPFWGQQEVPLEQTLSVPLHLHWLWSQTSPLPQDLPQPPQWLGLVVVSTQSSPGQQTCAALAHLVPGGQDMEPEGNERSWVSPGFTGLTLAWHAARNETTSANVNRSSGRRAALPGRVTREVAGQVGRWAGP